MIHASLFTGACGGFDLAAEWCGWENSFQVEILPEARKRLRQNFPTAIQYDDVRTFNGQPYHGQIDVLTGGFPCQDLSRAGRGVGLDGDRSGLWFEFERIIGEVRPGYVVIENSPRLLVLGFERVLSGLARLGYDAKWAVVRASDYGAPHQRERLYTIAYTNGNGRNAIPNWPECLTENGKLADWNHYQHGRIAPAEAGYEAWRPALTELSRLDDGLPGPLAKTEMHGYGNAIVPQIAHRIFQAIDNA